MIIGSARHDENGRYVNGKAGDQTGTEVSTQNFYVHKKGWNVIRAKTVTTRNKLAKAMKLACDNNNIGYSQSDRYGIIKTGVSTTTKTNADCSSLVRACCIYAGFDPGDFNTSNEVQVLEKTGKFLEAFKYDSSTELMAGDILVTCTKGHTAIITYISNEKNKTEYYSKYTGTSSSIVDALKAIGVTDTSLTHRKAIAVANGITGYIGAGSQNNKMLALLKAGQLKKG